MGMKQLGQGLEEMARHMRQDPTAQTKRNRIAAEHTASLLKDFDVLYGQVGVVMAVTEYLSKKVNGWQGRRDA